MSKYPNGDKVTTKNSEFGKANETNLLWDEGISQIYLSSELVIHEAVHESNVFHLYASSSLDYGICPYCGHASSQVHSRYFRTIQDMSILQAEYLHSQCRKCQCPYRKSDTSVLSSPRLSFLLHWSCHCNHSNE